MTKYEIENRISEAFENSTPDVYDKVIEGINDESNLISFAAAKSKKKKSHFAQRLVAVAAAAAVVFGLSYGSFSLLKPAASISLDVNPSIEMKINSRDRVIACAANNDDAVKILDGMELRGTDIDVAVNALIGSMLKNGYLDELKNSVLITVMDSKNAAALQEKLSVEISDLLNASIGSSAVISQTLAHDASVESVAKQYSISQGKAALVKELAGADSSLDIAQLAKLPVNDLNLLSATRKSESTSISTVGEASSKAYIGDEKAKALALELHPGAAITEVELDCYSGKMVYEIELVSGKTKYELELDAVSGECLNESSERAEADDYAAEKDDDDDDRNEDRKEEIEESEAFKAAAITESKAVEIALADAGLKKDDVKSLKTEQDTENHSPVYKIEFKYKLREYEYEIDAVTGKITDKD